MPNKAKEYLEHATGQELIMRKQIKQTLNAFTFRYAHIYQDSVATFSEDILEKQHAKRIEEILKTRYKYIIPFFSKFAYDEFIAEIKKSKQDILINQTDELVEDYIEVNAVRRAVGIAETSMRRIATRINLMVAEGASLTEIASGIRGVTKLNTRRAETIARTEVHDAANYAGLETAKNAESELDIVMEKEWVATVDARTRDSHIQANGQTVLVSEEFDIGGNKATRPLDPNLPADDTINCRCSMIFKRRR